MTPDQISTNNSDKLISNEPTILISKLIQLKLNIEASVGSLPRSGNRSTHFIEVGVSELMNINFELTVMRLLCNSYNSYNISEIPRTRF